MRIASNPLRNDSQTYFVSALSFYRLCPLMCPGGPTPKLARKPHPKARHTCAHKFNCLRVKLVGAFSGHLLGLRLRLALLPRGLACPVCSNNSYNHMLILTDPEHTFLHKPAQAHPRPRTSTHPSTPPCTIQTTLEQSPKISSEAFWDLHISTSG